MMSKSLPQMLVQQLGEAVDEEANSNLMQGPGALGPVPQVCMATGDGAQRMAHKCLTHEPPMYTTVLNKPS